MEFVRVTPRDDDGNEHHWLSAPSPVEAPPITVSPRSGRRGKAESILMAAMLGLVDALGWERPRDTTVQAIDAPKGHDGLALHYGPLEPLEPSE